MSLSLSLSLSRESIVLQISQKFNTSRGWEGGKGELPLSNSVPVFLWCVCVFSPFVPLEKCTQKEAKSERKEHVGRFAWYFEK